MSSGRIQWLMASTGPLGRLGSRLHARLFRATNGRFGRRWFGAPVMVLETVGRRSGKVRSSPVLCLRDGDDLVVVPANAGAARPPAWWLNLRDAGEGVAVVGDERRRVRPRVTEGAERERLWHEFVRMYPQAEDYTRFTTRRFPVVVLEKV
ncbi:MAG TPA: nitroreductase/quinone reductase family protein [Solirubrobacteraceae bacterium]|jgi:deazaflavin-dependent oxidoreductase (nitroreductase family)